MTVKDYTTVHVPADSELAELLKTAAKRPLTLVMNGARFRLTRDEAGEDQESHYDPEAARKGMRAAAGTWSDVDAEAFKAFIYRAREEGSRPPDRP